MPRSEDMENQKNVDNHPMKTSEQNTQSKAVAFSGKLITYIDQEYSNEEAREESIPLGRDAESREDHDVKVDDKDGEKKENNDKKDAEKNEESGDITESVHAVNPLEKKQSPDTDAKQDKCENVAKADDKKGEKKEDNTGDNDSKNMEENKEQADITDSVVNPLKKKDPEEESDSCGIKCLTFAVECCNCIIM